MKTIEYKRHTIKTNYNGAYYAQTGRYGIVYANSLRKIKS